MQGVMKKAKHQSREAMRQAQAAGAASIGLQTPQFVVMQSMSDNETQGKFQIALISYMRLVDAKINNDIGHVNVELKEAMDDSDRDLVAELRTKRSSLRDLLKQPLDVRAKAIGLEAGMPRIPADVLARLDQKQASSVAVVSAARANTTFAKSRPVVAGVASASASIVVVQAEDEYEETD